MNLENFAFDVIWKSFALMALAFALSPLTRKASAASRNLLWLCSLAALAILPLFSLAPPAIEIQTLHEAPRVLSTPRVLILPPVKAAATPPIELPAEPKRDSTRPLPLKETATWIWLSVVTLLLVRIGGQLACALIWLRKCRPFEGSNAKAVFAKMEVPKREPSLLTFPNVETPMTLGVVNPVIVLPEDAAGWSEAKLLSVLQHECAHIHRLDWLALVFSKLMCAIYWFNPLVWIAAKKLRAESEVAADDVVLLSGTQAVDYAGELLNFVIEKSRPAPVALALVETGGLKGRIESILSNPKRRSRISIGAALAGLFAANILVAPLARATFIQGPISVDTGYYDLGNHHSISLVAITDPNGKGSQSWNVKGEVFPEPFLLSGWDRLHPNRAFSGPLSRTLFFRTEVEGDVAMSVTPDLRLQPQTPTNTGYNRDLGKGTLLALDVALPDRPTADIHIWAPNSDWKPYPGKFIPTIARESANHCTVYVDLPATLSQDQCMLKVETIEGVEGKVLLPRFATGRQEVGLPLDTRDIKKCILHYRKVQHVLFKNVSLYPKAGTQVLPMPVAEVTEAKGNTVTLKSGAKLELLGFNALSDPVSEFWSPDGKVISTPEWAAADKRQFEKDGHQYNKWDPSYRYLAVNFRGHSSNGYMVAKIYDEYGRSLDMGAERLISYADSVSGTHYLKVWPTRDKVDLLVPTYTDTPFPATLSPLPVKAVNENTKEKSVHLTFDPKPFASVSKGNYSQTIEFLNKNHHTMEYVAYSGSLEEGEMSVNFMNHKPVFAPAYIRVKLTSCEWVRFKNVRLRPAPQ